MPVAVVVPRTTLQPETTGTCLAAAESGSFLFFQNKANDLYL